MNVAFDTLAYTKHLKQAGISDAQAEAQAEALAIAISEQIATKEDIRELKEITKNDIREVKEEIKDLRREMKEIELRMVIKMGAMQAVGIGIIVALMRLL